MPRTALASRLPLGQVLCARPCVGTFPACEKRSPATPAIAPYTARGGSEPDVDCGRTRHRFLTAAWEELGHALPLTVPNALEHPMWEFYDRLAGSRDLAPARRRRPMEQSRRRGGRKSLPPINRSPVSARGAHETEPCWSGLCGRPRNEVREVGLCPAVSSACKA